LLEKLLQFNPEKRLSAEQALSHPYFKDLFEPSRIVTAVLPFKLNESNLKSSSDTRSAILKTIQQHHFGDVQVCVLTNYLQKVVS
jgi:serine/threonine protein kinase